MTHRQSALLSGVGNTRVGAMPEASCLGLHAQATQAALADAGLSLRDIDGVICAYSFVEPYPMLSSVFCEYMGIQPAVTFSLQLGGATGATMIMQAAALVEAGYARHVLCVTADNRLSGMSRDGAVAALAGFGHPEFEVPYGLSIPAAYALVAQHHARCPFNPG